MLSLQNSERMIKALTEAVESKKAGLTVIEDLMEAEASRVAYLELSALKHEAKREIVRLEAQIDEHAQEIDVLNMLPFRIEATVQAIQETHGLNGLTKEQVILQVLEEKMGWV